MNKAWFCALATLAVATACSGSSTGGDGGSTASETGTGDDSGGNGGSSSSGGSGSGGNDDASSNGDGGNVIVCASSSTDLCTCFGYPPGTGSDNGQPCDSTSVGQGGICCKDPGFPDKAGSCQCFLYGCNTSTVLCTCGTGTSGPSNCAASTWSLCCQGPASCDCDHFSTMCPAGEVAVQSCPGPSPCPAGKLEVSSCR